MSEGLSAHERKRWLRWVAICEHRAVLPWIRDVARLAQAAEDAGEYRGALRIYARLYDELQDLEAEVRAMDPAWAWEVVDKCDPDRKPEGLNDG